MTAVLASFRGLRAHGAARPARPTACLGALLLALAASSCTDGRSSRDDAARIEQLLADADAARHGVVEAIADAVDAEFLSGTRRARYCGEHYAPLGVRVTDHLLFQGSPLGVAESIEVVVEVLEDQGWEVERVPRPTVVTGAQGDLEVRVDSGPGAFQVKISNPECLETGGDIARDFAERSGHPLGGP